MIEKDFDKFCINVSVIFKGHTFTQKQSNILLGIITPCMIGYERKYNKFFVCSDCGQTFKRNLKSEFCTECYSQDIGEIQIKW